MTCILIADDNPDLLQVNSIYLREQGFRVLTAANGVEAITTLQEEARRRIRARCPDARQGRRRDHPRSSSIPA